MAVRKMPLSSDEKAYVAQRLSRLAETLKTDRDTLMRIFSEAYAASSLDSHAVLSRMLWLFTPQEKTGVPLLPVKGTPIDATVSAVVHPKDTVFRYIVRHSILDEKTLEEVYRNMRSSRREGPDALDNLSEERILQEMKWWMVDLGLPDYYFTATPPAAIAQQILTNRLYEIQGFDSASYSAMQVSYRSQGGPTIHWVHRNRQLDIEQSIEQEYERGDLLINLSAYPHANLYLYMVEHSPAVGGGDTFAAACPRRFAETVPDVTRERYRQFWNAVQEKGSIVVEASRKEETAEYRLMIGFPRGFITHFLANVTRVMCDCGVEITRKYCATFGGARPCVILSCYAAAPFPQEILPRLVDVGLYPGNRIGALVEHGVLSPREANFAASVVEFVHQFVTTPDPHLELLRRRFSHAEDLQDTFISLQRRIDRDNYPFSQILDTFAERPDIIRELYELFAERFDPQRNAESRRQDDGISSFRKKIAAMPLGNMEAACFPVALLFIESVDRTNLFLPVKSACAFRLRGEFLAGREYRSLPYAVFFIKGRDFTGFHVRFQEIARGGIRILRSANTDEYLHNADTLFEECYNLALTQERKNKDIPEGGAKGVILPAPRAENPDAAFEKYVDALLDLIVPETAPLVRGHEEEMVFLGPDEGTAHLMDWACLRARQRGYRYWKSFSTGRSDRLGGISHIRYGMTTCGIRQYVLGIFEKCGVPEQSVTKVQTGGPDGDLGGNEILMSADRTICIIDGGGVIYDPDGLCREELRRLVSLRADSSHFDPSRLGPSGFKVTVADRDVTLPDGTRVVSGLSFRNSFHLDRRLRADLFLPCGGRPCSINATNWENLLDERGAPVYRWIVEGANLFLTQDARLKLEEKGVILFKDSSTNKGGVTSSSYEVLAGLVLDDREFADLMVVREDGTVPEFRKAYIEEIVARIRQNARDEFEILWHLHRETGKPLCVLSDLLSEKILEIAATVAGSTLWEDARIRQKVIAMHAPACLVKQVGLQTVMKRLPEKYQRAIFSRTLARSFVYRHGISPTLEEYRLFVASLSDGLAELPD